MAVDLLPEIAWYQAKGPRLQSNAYHGNSERYPTSSPISSQLVASQLESYDAKHRDVLDWLKSSESRNQCQFGSSQTEDILCRGDRETLRDYKLLETLNPF
jgi:hypothetical protein